MTELFASSAPVFRVDGQVRGELARDLVRLEVEETTAGLRTLTARFVAIGPTAGAASESLLYLDGRVLDFGKRIAVSIGPGDAERTVFTGTVSGLEASFVEAAEPHVVVFAEDGLMKLRLTRRSRTYRHVSDGDLARTIAGEHGLSADVAADGPTYDVVQQWNQSDLAFLRERARRLGAELWFLDGTLHFATRPNRRATDVTLVRDNELISVSVRADLAHQRTGVTVGGYDADRRDALAELAGSEAVQAEVERGRTGSDVLARALGEHPSYRVDDVPLIAGEARAWARAEMLRRSRAFVTAVGTTRGTPDLVVGSTVTLDGVGAPFDGGGYRATRVCHTYDLRDGHRTHFEAERPTVSTDA